MTLSRFLTKSVATAMAVILLNLILLDMSVLKTIALGVLFGIIVTAINQVIDEKSKDKISQGQQRVKEMATALNNLGCAD